MSKTNPDQILHVIARAPQWVKQDLISKDPAIRIRAEETLAALIKVALFPGDPA
jgi:hypothetical protein